jgi:hypothetical protein
MLQPGFSVAAIAAKRHVKSNPWFKRGALFRSAVDVMRRAGIPLTARQIAEGDPSRAKNAEDPSPVGEGRPTGVAAVQEAQLSVPKETGVNKDGRQFRTATEMADIILDALRAVDGVPERGFVVTVYGANPWNAMLTINPEAGPIKDAQLWRTRVQEIGTRLRQDFDVIHEL